MNRIFKKTIQNKILPNNLTPRYAQNSDIPTNLLNKIETQLHKTVNIPTVINGKEYLDCDPGNIINQYSPLDNKKICAIGHPVDYNVIKNHLISQEYKNSKKYWENLSIQKRIDIFENISNSIVAEYSDELLVSTIVGQGKSLYEAEIDAVCELVDFLNFNNYYADMINSRTYYTSDTEYNMCEISPLNGFVASITPFNFTAIGANLVSTPLLMGNSVLWKPSNNALLSNYTYYKLLLENNIPPGLISFIPMNPNLFWNNVSKQKDLAAVAFTGSTSVFSNIFKNIGENINYYNNYPRLIGETGGKNFHLVHKSANVKLAAKKTVESAFGYCGQKCSACSRLYVPKSLWEEFFTELIENMKTIDYSSYSLINSSNYFKMTSTLEKLKKDNQVNVIAGGNYSNDKINFIQPTIAISKYSNHEIFRNEYFSPFLSVYIYNDEDDDDKILNICATTSNYALTGAIFSDNISFIDKAYKELRHSAGNFYINDKSTGSVVGRQPFGGSGKSGTNDKAGDSNLLYRFMNQRSIKINLNTD